MKRTLKGLCVGLSTLGMAVAFVACGNEDPTAPSGSATSELGDQDASAAAAIPGVPSIPPQRFLPDLKIINYTTNIVPTSTLCGLTLPDVSCFGGQRGFMATITIKNSGRSIPAGTTLEVLWNDLTTGSSQTQVPVHNGIPQGGTILVTRPYYMGPCDCAPPPTSFQHNFNAVVDPNNLIPELREGNNTSATYVTCDGC